MKTITKEKILEFGANLAQISIWTGIAYVLGNPQTLPFVLPAYLSKEVLSTTLGALTGNKFGELVAKLIKISQGKNQELNKVINKVLEKILPNLERDILKYYSKSNDELQSAISSLFAQYNNIDFRNFDISQQTNYELIKHFANPFEYLLATPFEDWKGKYNKGNSLPEDFEKVFVERFIIIFIDMLHRQLKDEDNKKASVEYTLCLLELGIEMNKENQKLLFQANEILSSLKSNTEVLIGYTKNILALNELLVQLAPSISRDIKNIKEEIIDEIKKQNQPNLLVPAIDTYKRDVYDFRYKAQYTTFLGRDMEINSLREFALTSKTDKKFHWWYLTGKGGSGKSRLAYELCIQLKLWDFYAGFLEKSLLMDTQLWHKWMPVKNTFIVIDYANEKSDSTIELLKILETRQVLFNYSVRVLLIDRELNKEMLEKLSIEIEVENSSYTNDLSPIVLSDASDDILWGIIQEVHLKKEKKIAYEKKELLMYLYNIDNLKRPLFAFLAGVALVEGDDIRGWNKSELLEKLIVREENKVWNLNKVEKPIYEKHKTLLVIATLLRGVSNEFIAHLDSNNYVWFNPSIQIDNDIYNRISSSLLIGDKTHYLGLEPDILGEYFVIRHLSKMIERASNGKDNILALLSELWSYRSDNFVFMLSMLVQDFDDCTGTDLVVYKMLLNAKPINSLNIRSWVTWSIYRNFVTI